MTARMVLHSPVATVSWPRRDLARPAGSTQSDRGSGTIWVIVMIALVAAVALSAAAIGGAMVTRHRASAAADLSALAAADAAARAAADPCGVAAQVAREYGADLTSCAVDGFVVDVVVRLAAGGLLGDGRAATVRARAGPS